MERLEYETDRRSHRHQEFRAQKRHPLVILADNIDKTSNLGGILRVADAFLVARVLVNRDEPDVVGAQGAQYWQPVEWAVDLRDAVDSYHDQGYSLVALEQTPVAQPIDAFHFPEKCLLALGAEMYGVSNEVLALADHVVFIPQAGMVKSLNVVTAAAIALYEYSRQHWMDGFDQPARHLAAADESLRVENQTAAQPESAA